MIKALRHAATALLLSATALAAPVAAVAQTGGKPTTATIQAPPLTGRPCALRAAV